eukprot:jgi/Botrbrau1/10320/Bobra.0321s0001.1
MQQPAVLALGNQEQAQFLAQSVGEDMSNQLETHSRLQKEYAQRLEDITFQRTSNSNRTIGLDGLHRVSEQIRASTRVLSRNLQDNPNLVENLNKVAVERAQLQALLMGCLKELTLERGLPSLATYVNQHERRERQVKETLERERALDVEVQGLKSTIKSERQKHDSEMRDQRTSQAESQQRFRCDAADAAAMVRFHALKVSATKDCKTRLREAELQELQETVDDLKIRINTEAQCRDAIAQQLTAQTTTAQEEAMAWSRQLASDLSDLENQLVSTTANQQRYLIELRKMREKCDAEKQLKSQRDKEARLEEELAARAMERVNRKERAAVLIQALWRGWTIRNHKSQKGTSKRGAVSGKIKGVKSVPL